ncbi:hypothetical protein [Synechococcus sp. PCC 7336]|uniref:hypothetical protein n=1 Tax=Synechococcus sp. PCC 7336 TaxID=195250 RepID=UPI00034D5291|nr:hypothetical protein [Synechococcus sp. PCC 7336]
MNVPPTPSVTLRSNKPQLTYVKAWMSKTSQPSVLDLLEDRLGSPIWLQKLCHPFH